MADKEERNGRTNNNIMHVGVSRNDIKEAIKMNNRRMDANVKAKPKRKTQIHAAECCSENVKGKQMN